jgi:uncharacterized membrane protein
MKRNNMMPVVTTAICLLPIILSVAVYPKLPDEVAVHFDSSGNADGYLPKALAAFGLPVLIALINLYSSFMRRKDPKTERSSVALRTFVTWLIPLISVVLVPVTLFMSMGADIPLHIIVPAIVGVIITVCGNYLPKSKHNYTVGIKLPWTLHSETNWNKTHRFAGYLWVAGGIAIVIISCLNINLVILDIAIIVLLVAAPVIYSYLTYKRETAGSGDNSHPIKL